jgi:dipeptidyl aminopeptidase/acylaminoacyl peptidase
LNLRDGKLTRWTFSEVGGLDTAAFISPTPFQYKTFDERMIPAFYFRPPGARKDKPAAVVINIHGGPESQYRPYFSSFDQYLLNELGIAVIRPNVRGSAGYGKAYLQLDNAEKREDSVKDIGALLDWVKEQPELDASRVAVYGGSYGGYMVLASMAHFPERIKAGVDIVGLASFTTFLKNTKEYRRDLRRAEYGDERDPKIAALFERINPTSNVQKITSALLVAHGRNDPRVPFVVAEEVVAKVEAQGKKVWTIYAANEGHGFRKKANRDYLTAAIVMFLWEHLQ